MKRTTILTLSAVATAAVIGAIAIPAIAHGWDRNDDGGRQQTMRMMHGERADPTQDHRGGRHVAHAGPKGMRGMTGNPVYQSFDTDADGTLTPAERQAGMAALHAAHDANGNGALSPDEFAALFADVTRSRADRPFAMLDADKDGQISAEEITDPAQRMTRMQRMPAPAGTEGQ